MRKLIYLFLALLIVACSQNEAWTNKEKNNYMAACITNYNKVKPNNLQEARCYCIQTLNLTIDLYPNAKDADSKMTMSELKLISNKATKNLKEINDIGTCL
jgi:hypothetical protein|tara:strand:- start:233 stop:535 length:303 start_codon:yes stop_codon:yes gene_type:complete